VRFDIVIVGGGLAGASLAVALKNSRYSIALIEGAAPLFTATDARNSPEAALQANIHGHLQGGLDSRIYAVSPSSAAFLHDIGVWQHLDASRITPVYDMKIRGDRGARLNFSAYDASVGELAWIVESRLMQRELWETAKRQGNLQMFCPAKPRQLAFEPNGKHDLTHGLAPELTQTLAHLTLTDGRTLEASLVIGADGADSWVRNQTPLTDNTNTKTTLYGEKGVVANFACELPHHNTAFQWFRPDGVLAYLPLPEQRISIVWATPDHHADDLMALTPEALCRRVAEGGEHRLGALELLAPPAAFPLRLMRLSHCVAPRLALIGDAAHAIHPLAGHGINLGFHDAKTLADILLNLPTFQDCGDLRTLRRYERSRAEEVALLQWATHGLQRLFKPQNAPLSALRNFGLNLTNQLPVVRNTLVRYALG